MENPGSITKKRVNIDFCKPPPLLLPLLLLPLLLLPLLPLLLLPLLLPLLLSSSVLKTGMELTDEIELEQTNKPACLVGSFRQSYL